MSFEDMDMFNGHLVLFLEKGGFPAVCSVMMPFFNNCKVRELVLPQFPLTVRCKGSYAFHI